MKTIQNVDGNEVVERVKAYFSGRLRLEDFLSEQRFLASEQFLFKLFTQIPNAEVVTVMKHWVMEYPSIESLEFDKNKGFLAFIFEEFTITENFEVFSFIIQSMKNGFNIAGTLFNKGQYSISLSQTTKGWILYKCSGNQKFNSWGEGCVACCEMGFTIKAIMYTKNWQAIDSGSSSIDNVQKMKEMCNSYKVISTVNDYFN